MLVKLTDLIHLKLTLYNLYFDDFEPILMKFCSPLQLFSITMEFSERSFLDGDRWEKLIFQHMSHLKKFFFRYTDVNNTNLQVSPFHSLLNRITSSFWINRKWSFKLSLEMNELIYSIHPYKYIPRNRELQIWLLKERRRI